MLSMGTSYQLAAEGYIVAQTVIERKVNLFGYIQAYLQDER